MRYNHIALFIVGLMLSEFAFANNYPLEFADFFEERFESIEVVIPGEQRSQTVVGVVSYDTFRLNNDKSNIELLETYLITQRFTTKAIDKIVTSLKNGIIANPGCKGDLSACLPPDVPGEAEFVFDFDAKMLKLFVESNMLEKSSDKEEYYSSLRNNNALINWSDLYFYVDGDNSKSISWVNNATLGLPLGFLSLDTQYQHREREFDIYQALYDLEIEGYRALVGYQSRNSASFNTTDFLSYGANYAGLTSSIGSSKNLLKGQELALQRIYFFSPQSAQLEVYQGERLLFSKIVSQGQQSIGYNELPSGVYTITLVLRQGEEELLREQRQVVNSSQFSLPVKALDFRVDAGVLDDLNNSDILVNESVRLSDRAYGRMALSFRPYENWLFGTGVTTNLHDTFLQFGGSWAHEAGLSAQYSLGYFTSGSQSHFGQISAGNFNSSLRRVDANNKSSGLTRLLLGDTESTDWSVGVSGEVIGGIGYLNYFNYKLDGSQSDNITLSWSRDAFGGRFNVSTNYNMSGSNQSSWSTILTWTYNIGDDVSARTGMYFDRDGFTHNQSNLTYQYSGDQVFASSTAGIKLGRDGKVGTELSGNLSGHNSSIGYSAYGYLSNEGHHSISGNLSGTQVILANDFATSNEQGRTFIKISPESNDDEMESTLKMNYNLLKDGKRWSNNEILVDDTKVVRLADYADMSFKLDAESDNVDIDNNEYQAFVMPGSFYQLNTSITPLVSQIFVLNDMFGQPITSARCLGEACKNVEPLSDDGVFRVNYRKNKPFKLVSSKRLCVFDPELIGDNYIQAYCLPGLEEVDSNIVWEDRPDIIAPKEAERALLYVGQYQSTDELSRILSRLQSVGLSSKAIDVGNYVYVYVRYLEKYSANQRSLLESLDTYVVLDSLNINQLFSKR